MGMGIARIPMGINPLTAVTVHKHA